MNELEQIRVTVSRYQEAVRTQDEDDFKALWTGEDGNTLISGQKLFSGLDCIFNDFVIGGLQQLYEKFALINEGLDVHLINATTAVAVFRYHTECIRRESHEPYEMEGIETQVLKKIGSTWKIFHIHYSGKERESAPESGNMNKEGL